MKVTTNLEQIVDLLQAAAFQLGKEEDEEEEGNGGAAHKDESDPSAHLDLGSRLEVRRAEGDEEGREDVDAGRPSDHSLAHLDTADLGADEPALGRNAKLADSVQQDDRSDDDVVLIGGAIGKGSDTADERAEHDGQCCADDAEVATSNNIGRSDGDEAAKETSHGDEDAVLEGLKAETDGGEEGGAVRVGELLAGGLAVSFVPSSPVLSIPG